MNIFKEESRFTLLDFQGFESSKTLTIEFKSQIQLIEFELNISSEVCVGLDLFYITVDGNWSVLLSTRNKTTTSECACRTPITP